MSSSKVLVVGHRGQDGTLIRKSLARQRREVVGLGREGLDYYDAHGRRASFHPGQKKIRDVVREELPSEIYYLAAEHSSSEGDLSSMLSASSFARLWETNVAGFLRMLEAVRIYSPDTHVFYASSSHVFGPGDVRLLSEASPLEPKSFYGITKAEAMWLADKFRREAGLHVSSGILFNHESPLRGPAFLSTKIIQGALQIQRGRISEIRIGNLDARADWGHASDFVEAFQLLVRRDSPGDYVIATGETHSVREFVSIVFAFLGMDWRDHVRQDHALTGATQNIEKASPAKLFAETNWRPKLGFEDFVRHLVLEHRGEVPHE